MRLYTEQIFAFKILKILICLYIGAALISKIIGYKKYDRKEANEYDEHDGGVCKELVGQFATNSTCIHGTRKRTISTLTKELLIL